MVRRSPIEQLVRRGDGQVAKMRTVQIRCVLCDGDTKDQFGVQRGIWM